MTSPMLLNEGKVKHRETGIHTPVDSVDGGKISFFFAGEVRGMKDRSKHVRSCTARRLEATVEQQLVKRNRKTTKEEIKKTQLQEMEKDIHARKYYHIYDW